MYPSDLIDQAINRSVSNKLVPGHVYTSSNQDCSIIFLISNCRLLVTYSSFTQKRLAPLAKRYWTNINIKLVFKSLKIGSLFSVKDPVPSDMRARVDHLLILVSLLYSQLCWRNSPTSSYARQ